jgi:hypothetical protein
MKAVDLPQRTQLGGQGASRASGRTAEGNDVNPIDYLHDVLLRISTHPADRIDELLPDRWKPAESP